jgi:glutamate dehydrogenase
MQQQLEHTKEELIAKAAEYAASRRGHGSLDPEQAAVFLSQYYGHVAVEDLADRDPADIYGAAMSHYRLAAKRPQGTAKVQVSTPTVDVLGWSADGHTVVEIVVDDMPFLVDSVTMELTSRGCDIHLVIHPQLMVRRDVAGNLLEILEPEAPPQGHESVRESWMHVEIDRETDAETLAEIESALVRVLRDVNDAVEDWAKMRATALAIVDDIKTADLPIPEEEVDEATALLQWLADDHFTFLGYREYALQKVGDDDVLKAVPGTGLGILRSDQDMGPSVGKLPALVSAKAREKQLLIITKANSRATVHRPAYLDYIGVKRFDASGEVVGERRFLGLFPSAAYTESISRIPVLRRKVAEVLEGAGFDPMSHSGKVLTDILETYPRDELFQIPVDELLPIADAVLHLQERRQLRLFVRRDVYGRYLSCLVYLPRDRYTTQVRERMQDILTETLGEGSSVEYTARVSESVLARLHFVVRPGQGPIPDFDEALLEERLVDAARSWDDDFQRALHEMYGEDEAARLSRVYAEGFPEAYKEDFPATVAAVDVRRLEDIDPETKVALSLYKPVDAAADERRFKVFRTGSPLSLSNVLPMLSQMGVEVVDERPFPIDRVGAEQAWIYDLGLRYSTGPMPDDARELFQDAFLAVWLGRCESDGFNRLVLGADLSWRQAMVLRAYAKYLRQGATAFSQHYIEDSLTANVPIARSLVELFEARLDPGTDGSDTVPSPARAARAQESTDRIERALDEVSSLDQDRILRSMLTVISATLRTNYFQVDEHGEPKPYLSIKLAPEEIPELPQPRPRFEIFVYSPRVEGVHLRFGHVARGGLRWSDRREDFRTEVLGLVKAQMVKNAVIVPVGAKGGFFPKQLPDPAADRDAWLAEGIFCYRRFICGLLDITDNRVDGANLGPPRVVRHDTEDDAYLVVAADKGTAAFSDMANEVAADYGFWLGDAFASGGSVGYDHKAMGITARGAWESVRRHFRDMGIDPAQQDFTCVGIGDMSGDVFGNGMLLSEHIALVAAFDHRHIFLDPDPDPAASYAERRRLFDLPRSSWADYDESVISAGGGVFPRTAKSVPVTEQVRAALGLDSSVERLSPAELMRAILLAPVDLLWNGGIGTYVKASSETQAAVGDKANDAIRVNGNELRCRCVGEGGNLGFTQLGRIEYALAGGRINTDFIDNSAGVDTSDHEVNIKILLDRVVADGDLTYKQRNELLAAMTDEVGTLVLRHNYDQNVALANALAQAPPLLHVHADWIRRLEKAGLLNRSLEFLPTNKQMLERRSEGRGLTAPELAVLMSYTKIVLSADLVDTDLPDDPFLSHELINYFPTPMRDRFGEQIESHPLRREIIVTQIVNRLVDGAGITFFHRLSEETGATSAELARGNLLARVVFELSSAWDSIEALDDRVASDVQVAMRLEIRTLAERATRWLVNNRRPPLDSESILRHFGPGVSSVLAHLPKLVVGREAQAAAARRDELVASGVPESLASQIAVMPTAYAALGIVETARRAGRDPLDVARLHFALGARLGLNRLVQRILALPRDDRWQTMARAALRDDLQAVHAQLTAQILDRTDDGQPVDQRIKTWERREGVGVPRALKTLDDICTDDRADLARLSVGLRVVRRLISTD